MKTKRVGAESNKMGVSALPEAFSEPAELLPTLFDISTVGLAIIDRQLRFQAINEALARINGVSAEAHLGKTLRHILGKAAAKVEPAFKRVFCTAQRAHLEFTAELPARTGAGHWIADYFPIRAGGGEVAQVGAIVVEVTNQRKVENSLQKLTGKLLLLDAALKMNLYRTARTNGSSIESDSVLKQSVQLLEDCITETRTISDLVQSPMEGEAYQDRRSKRAFAAEPFSVGSVGEESSSSPAEKQKADGFANRLSPREHEVIQLLAGSKSNKEISARLGITVRTAETHRARIMLKLNLHSLAELVRYAVRNHIIEA